MDNKLNNDLINLLEENGIGYVESKMGFIEVLTKNTKVTAVNFVIKPDLTKVLLTKTTKEAINQLEEYLKGTRKDFSLDLDLIGTAFQIKVWNELLKIPYGETISYQELAIRIGNIDSARAVGMANNKNKISIIVPCHRVIGKNGSLTGYEGGIHIKEYLLNLEGSNKM